MTYDVFSGTLKPTLSIEQKSKRRHILLILSVVESVTFSKNNTFNGPLFRTSWAVQNQKQGKPTDRWGFSERIPHLVL